MDIAMTVNPADKMVTAHEPKIEKWLLRKKHFEDLLPESIAWRQKEQFLTELVTVGLTL